jgi:hypothetical protein
MKREADAKERILRKIERTMKKAEKLIEQRRLFENGKVGMNLSAKKVMRWGN